MAYYDPNNQNNYNNYNYNQPPTGYAAPTKSLAVTGLVLSFILPLVGLIISYVANSKIKKGLAEGRNLAVAGIVVGWVFIVATIIATPLIIWGTLQLIITLFGGPYTDPITFWTNTEFDWASLF